MREHRMRFCSLLESLTDQLGCPERFPVETWFQRWNNKLKYMSNLDQFATRSAEIRYAPASADSSTKTDFS